MQSLDSDFLTLRIAYPFNIQCLIKDSTFYTAFRGIKKNVQKSESHVSELCRWWKITRASSNEKSLSQLFTNLIFEWCARETLEIVMGFLCKGYRAHNSRIKIKLFFSLPQEWYDPGNIYYLSFSVKRELRKSLPEGFSVRRG